MENPFTPNPDAARLSRLDRLDVIAKETANIEDVILSISGNRSRAAGATRAEALAKLEALREERRLNERAIHLGRPEWDSATLRDLDAWVAENDPVLADPKMRLEDLEFACDYARAQFGSTPGPEIPAEVRVNQRETLDKLARARAWKATVARIEAVRAKVRRSAYDRTPIESIRREVAADVEALVSAWEKVAATKKAPLFGAVRTR